MYNSDDIFLRNLERNDALISFHWRNDPDVWKYTGSRPDRVITQEIELEWIDKILADTTRKTFAICLKKDSRYIGNVQVTNITNEKADFHIFIGDKNYWGQGIGSIATAKLLKIAKNDLGLKKLKLWVHSENTAARKIYIKNGFIPVDEQGNMEIIL